MDSTQRSYVGKKSGKLFAKSVLYSEKKKGWHVISIAKGGRTVKGSVGEDLGSIMEESAEYLGHGNFEVKGERKWYRSESGGTWKAIARRGILFMKTGSGNRRQARKGQVAGGVMRNEMKNSKMCARTVNSDKGLKELRVRRGSIVIGKRGKKGSRGAKKILEKSSLRKLHNIRRSV